MVYKSSSSGGGGSGTGGGSFGSGFGTVGAGGAGIIVVTYTPGGTVYLIGYIVDWFGL